MDREIDSVFRNVTDDDFDGYEHALHTHFFEYLEILIGIVGITLDVLVVLVFWRNRTMRTRTNVIIMNCFIMDVFFLLAQIFFDGFLLEMGDHMGRAGCLLLHTEGIAEMASVLLTLLLLSNKAMKTKELTTLGVLTCVYLIVGVYYAALVVQCTQFPRTPFVVQGLTVLALCLALSLATIVKDINRCRRTSAVPLSDDSNHRLFFAKILTYNWLASFLFLFFLEADAVIWFKLIGTSLYLTSTYRFAYVFVEDVKFRMCILHLLRCDFQARDLDDTENLVNESGQVVNKNNSVVVNFNAPTANVA